MLRKHRTIAGIICGALILILLAFLFFPYLHRTVGKYHYKRAKSYETKIEEIYSKDFPSPDGSIPRNISRQTERLGSAKERSCRRSAAALSRAKRIRPAILNDHDLVVLANARIRALGGGYPPSHTISEMRETGELAKKELREALQLNPKNKEAYSSLIQAYFHQNELLRDEHNFEEILEVCRQFETAFPDDPEMHSLYGITYWSLEDSESGKRHLTRALELDPASPAALHLHMLLVQDGKIDEGIELLERYVATNVQTSDIAFAKQHLCSIKEAKETIKTTEAMLEQNPNDFELVRSLAEAYSQIGASETAYQWHQKAYEINPEDRYAISRLAHLKSSRDPAASIILFKKLLKIADSPYSRKGAMTSIANIHFSAGNMEQALEWYEKAESEPGYYPPLLFRIAIYYDKIGNDELAEEYSRRSIREHERHEKEIRRNRIKWWLSELLDKWF